MACNQSTVARMTALVHSLVERGVLEQHAAEHVIGLLESSDEQLDRILANLSIATETQVASLYAAKANLPMFLSTGEARLAPLPDDMNIDFLRTKRIAPIEAQSDEFNAIVVNPFEPGAISGLQFALQSELKFAIATASQFDALFSSAELDNAPSEFDEPQSLDLAADAHRLKDMASEEPIVRLVSRIVSQGAEQRASDIHLEPRLRDALIKYRVDGILQERQRLSRDQALAVVSRIKILSQLDIAERRRPQDGRFSFSVAGAPVDLRVSTMPTEHGESLVIRILDHSSVALDFQGLGFSNSAQAALSRLVAKPNGIVLVTGPTGSGKTTTLYAMLRQLADGERKILTIEDPIEQRLDGVSQTQANKAIGLDFAAALKHFLRHDPDVIMVGEIRDIETARIAVQAALTGHLVFSTLHTNDAVSTITRLIDMGVEDYLIASTLNGVVAQRLVRRRCGACFDRAETSRVDCPNCAGAGFVGRTAISEILEMNARLERCLRNGWTPSEVASVLQTIDFQSMEDDGLIKLKAGEIEKAGLTCAVGAHG